MATVHGSPRRFRRKFLPYAISLFFVISVVWKQASVVVLPATLEWSFEDPNVVDALASSDASLPRDTATDSVTKAPVINTTLIQSPLIATVPSMSEALQANTTSTSGLSLLWKFRHQVISKLPPKSITVVLWPFMDSATKDTSSADVVHIEKDGVEQSSVLTLAQLDNSSIVQTTVHHADSVVWVTDAKFGYKLWCTRLHQKAVRAQEQRREAGLPSSWPVFVVDFTDMVRYQSCPPLEETLGRDNIIYSKRSIVANRTWNFDKDWMDLGQRLPAVTQGRFYHYAPLVVRTDIVETVEQLLLQHSLLPTRNLTLADPIERLLPRPVDVAHYWPPSTDKAQFSNLRNRFSTLLVQHFSNYTVYCDIIGTPDRVGRRHAQTNYVQAMLETKIIVVGQRDKWEDHYRLYEALVSGAMVISDVMLAVPDGLQNGTNIILVHSAQDFIQQVQYYLDHEEERLAIAKAGRFLAMSRHRSWHRMEEIILGQRVTTCDTKDHASSCPFTINSNAFPLPSSHTT